MARKKREASRELISLIPDDYGGLLSVVPEWVARGLSRRLANRRLVLVSAVCPDYARANNKFTYRGLGEQVPYTAAQHLDIAGRMGRILSAHGIIFEYHMTLADTEFDLPLVVNYMTEGDVQEFIRRCQRSCDELLEEARRRKIVVRSCQRFTEAFPDWFKWYEEAKEVMRREAAENVSTSASLESSASARQDLYSAMTGKLVSRTYAREMVIRQWAQYMAWGKCAELKYGPELVMMNHTTPNLLKVNHSYFRAGRERIPIIQLVQTTMPGE